MAAGLKYATVASYGVHHGAALGNGVGKGFFTVDVLARLRRGDADDGVPMVGRGNHDGVDIVARQHLAEIMVFLDA
ncbi:MAG: hypothetical protein BWX80_03536 [Candidatus Hydrogenedentes bacterium ADurb.Bin101]|nr:MAG: hypothetical protein BWX80_03536 [Candidatus Hydrogenedentes bacterium ADurb.Bin101]